MKELPEWGFMLDFTHPKAITNTSQVTSFSGQRGGNPVGGVAPISTDISAFEMSHGYNFLTLNFMRRWFPKGQRDNTFVGRLQPYAGIGAGAAIPHVEATVGGVTTARYDSAGWTMQGMLGVNFDIWGPISAFVEYKLNYAHVDIGLNGGSNIETQTWTHQFIIGLAVRF